MVEIIYSSDLYRACGDPHNERESLELHNKFSQQLSLDQYHATQAPEHAYITVSVTNSC